MSISAGRPRIALDRAAVSHVAHELRAPLAVVLGYASFLADGAVGDLEPEQREILARVRRSARELDRLIADVAELARVLIADVPGVSASGAEADGDEPDATATFERTCERLRAGEAEPLDLTPALADAIELARDLAAGRGVEVRVVPSAEPIASFARALGEPVQIRQALLAVATYMARSTRSGAVDVAVSRASGEIRIEWWAQALVPPAGLAASLDEPLVATLGGEEAVDWRVGLAAARVNLGRLGGRLECGGRDGGLALSVCLRTCDP